MLLIKNMSLLDHGLLITLLITTIFCLSQWVELCIGVVKAKPEGTKEFDNDNVLAIGDAIDLDI